MANPLVFSMQMVSSSSMTLRSCTKACLSTAGSRTDIIYHDVMSQGAMPTCRDCYTGKSASFCRIFHDDFRSPDVDITLNCAGTRHCCGGRLGLQGRGPCSPAASTRPNSPSAAAAAAVHTRGRRLHGRGRIMLPPPRSTDCLDCHSGLYENGISRCYFEDVLGQL